MTTINNTDFLEESEDQFSLPPYQYDEGDYEFTADVESIYRNVDKNILRTLY